MSYVNVGTIEYQGQTHTITVLRGQGPESWEKQRALYFPDYEGPGPEFLERAAIGMRQIADEFKSGTTEHQPATPPRRPQQSSRQPAAAW